MRGVEERGDRDQILKTGERVIETWVVWQAANIKCLACLDRVGIKC